MSALPRITLTPLAQTTLFAPLVALGFYVRNHDLLAPVFSRLRFDRRTHTVCPEGAILDLWVSMLAGCRSVSHINTRIRPDHLLAQAWGRPCFYEQSTVARVLDACQAEQVDQLRAGVEAVYRWIGQAPRHPWRGSLLTVDIDLTGLPAGRQAEGSTKGYFSGKKGAADGNCAVSGPPITMRAWPHCCIRATPSARRCWQTLYRPWSERCASNRRNAPRSAYGSMPASGPTTTLTGSCVNVIRWLPRTTRAVVQALGDSKCRSGRCWNPVGAG